MKYTLLFFPVLFIALFSCNSSKRIDKNYLYFQKGLDSVKLMALTEPKVKPFDQLTIQVLSTTSNQEQTTVFNLTAGGSSTGSTSGASGGGYQVDLKGYIYMPIIGEVYVSGLTIKQIKALLKEKLSPWVKEVELVVKFATFNITLLGEVAVPGIKNYPNQRNTIIDVLVQSGELPVTARRDSIIVIREDSGKLKHYRINLLDASCWNSPVYQIQQNDIIYVPASIRKLRELEYSNHFLIRDLSNITSIITLLTFPLTTYYLIFRR